MACCCSSQFASVQGVFTHVYWREDEGSGRDNCFCVLQATIAAAEFVGGAWTRTYTLLGRDWLKYLKLDWNQLLFHRVHAVTMGSNLDTSNPKLQKVLERHAAVFKEELGTIVGQSAVINVKPDAQPVFCRARQVPYA